MKSDATDTVYCVHTDLRARFRMTATTTQAQPMPATLKYKNIHIQAITTK